MRVCVRVLVITPGYHPTGHHPMFIDMYVQYLIDLEQRVLGRERGL